MPCQAAAKIKKSDLGIGVWVPLHGESPIRMWQNISLKLTPKVRLWFVGGPVRGVRFALVIRRGSLTRR